MAVNNEPNSAQARYLLGLAFYGNKKLDQAESAWNEAIRVDSRFLPPYLNLAKLKLASRDMNNAIHFAEETLRNNPNQPDALLVLGNAHLAKNENKATVEAFQKLVALTPQNPVSLERLGMAYGQAGDLARAEAQLEAA